MLQEVEFRDLAATVFQHEFDHLGGQLFVDRLANSRLLALDKEYERHHR